MQELQINIADLFMDLEMFKRKVKELRDFPDLPVLEKIRVRSIQAVLKKDIEEILGLIGSQ